MAIELSCPCGRVLELPAHMAGRSVSCPNCRRALTAPEADEGGEHYGVVPEPEPLPSDALPAGEFRDPALRATVRKALKEKEEEKEREWLRHHGGSRYNRAMIEGMVAMLVGGLFMLFGTVLGCFWVLAALAFLFGAYRYVTGKWALDAELAGRDD